MDASLVSRGSGVVRGKQDYGETDLGMLLELLDYRAALVRLFMEDYGFETQPRQEPSDGLLGAIVRPVNNEDLVGSSLFARLRGGSGNWLLLLSLTSNIVVFVHWNIENSIIVRGNLHVFFE